MFFKLNRFSRLIILISLLILPGLNETKSQERLTNYIIKAGAGFNGNIYNSSFTELPGYSSCCTEYTGAFGYGGSLFAGGEYLFENKIFGGKLGFDFLLGYSGISANFSEEEFIGNFIDGNTVTPVNVEYNIQPVVNVLFVDPGFSFAPIESIPASFRAGFRVGFPLSETFYQEERLTNPPGVKFRNGTVLDNVHSGDLPNAAGQLFFITLGARYELMKFSNFTIVPEINFMYGLNNVITSLNWKINTLTAGVTINYRVPKSALPPPPPPPPAPLPEPPKEKPLIVTLGITSNGNDLKDKDTIEVPVTVNMYVKNYTVLPLIFFNKNSGEIKIGSSRISDRFTAQQNSLEAIRKYLKENPGARAKVTISSTTDEDNTIAEERKKSIIEALKAYANRLEFATIVVPEKDIKPAERADEYRNASFNFLNGSAILTLSDTLQTRQAGSMDITIQPSAGSEAGPVDMKGSVNYKGRTLLALNGSSERLTIDEAMPGGLPGNSVEQLIISLIATDAEGKEGVSEKTLIIREQAEKRVFYNLTEGINPSVGRELLLGYNEFDDAGLTIINEDAVRLIKNFLESNPNSKIEIMALTDNFGTKEYNEKLARERARTAIRKAGLREENTEIIYPVGYLFPNDSPEGRLLNRAVLVRIN